MRLKRSKTGDTMARPSWRSSFLSDAGAKFFCETEQTGQDAGVVRETGEPNKQAQPRPKLTYCNRKMVLTLGSTAPTPKIA